MVHFFMYFFIGILFKSVFDYLFNNIKIISKMREIEIRFLLLAANLAYMREYSLAILEIVYLEAVKEGHKDKNEYEKAKSLIESKFDAVLNNTIKNMQTYIPYKLEYTDWKSASAYIERLKNKLAKIQTGN